MWNGCNNIPGVKSNGSMGTVYDIGWLYGIYKSGQIHFQSRNTGKAQRDAMRYNILRHLTWALSSATQIAWQNLPTEQVVQLIPVKCLTYVCDLREMIHASLKGENITQKFSICKVSSYWCPWGTWLTFWSQRGCIFHFSPRDKAMKESKPDLLVVIVGMSVTDSLCNGYHSNYQHHSNQFIYWRSWYHPGAVENHACPDLGWSFPSFCCSAMGFRTQITHFYNQFIQSCCCYNTVIYH